MPKTKKTKTVSKKVETTPKSERVVKREVSHTIDTVGEHVFISDGKYSISVDYDMNTMRIQTPRGEKFCFSDDKTKETVKRWRAIAELILTATLHLEGVVKNGKK